MLRRDVAKLASEGEEDPPAVEPLSDHSADASADPPDDVVMSVSPRDIGAGEQPLRAVGPGMRIDEVASGAAIDDLLERAAVDLHGAAAAAGIERRDVEEAEVPPDRSAPNEPALAALVARAEAAAAELRAGLEQADRRDVGTTRAAVHLQDRLRLGARMLKAFNDQVAAAQGSLQSLDGACREADRHAASLSDVFRRIESATVLEDRLAALTARAQTLINAAEGAEVNIATLLHRAARAAARAEELAMKGEAIEGGASVRDDLLTLLCTAMQQADDLERRAARLEAIEDRLGQLARRLAPWAALLDKRKGASHPEIVVEIKNQKTAKA